MQNKRPVFILGSLILLVGEAAFVAGRLLNQQQIGPVDPSGPLGGEGQSFSVQLIPANELLKTEPEVTGQFVERKDKTIILTSAPLETGVGGVVGSSAAGEESDGPSTSSNDMPGGPKVEVIVTSETTIYRDTTHIGGSSGESQTVQETVGEGSLDDLNTDSMVRVWGRQSGDRIVADVFLYMDPYGVKK